MRRDLTAWALVVAGLALPLAAHAAGISFIVRDVDGGPYFLFSPLWFLIGQPLLLLGFLLQERTLFAVGAGFNAILGLSLLLGSIVQLPVALIAPSAGIEEMSRLEILLAHVTAILIGATGTGLAAWTTKK